MLDAFFSSYRKLFAVIFIGNLVALIVLVALYHGLPPGTSAGTATSVNLMIAFLFRQENFVNLVHGVIIRAPHSLPLSVRRRLAKVYHYGGFHSGCAMAAVVWYFLYVALATREFTQRRTKFTTVNMATAYVLILMFSAILVGAHPRFRARFHDHFEAVHRFAGWTALGAFWIQTVFAALLGSMESKVSVGLYMIEMPSFWCLGVASVCVVLSWLRLRKRKVTAEVLSSHATRLHFEYGPMKPFFVIRVSDRPLFEWHGFATIPSDNNGFSIIVSNAGDWTRRHIQESPKYLWIRSDPLYGLLCVSRLFKKIVVVATGSGIGPCLSLFHAHLTPCRVLWSTPSPESTYGRRVIDSIFTADPHAVIWDTRRHGRPNMVALTNQLYSSSGAEAVFIVSNPKVTRKVVYAMSSRGIPAYGPIFDS